MSRRRSPSRAAAAALLVAVAAVIASLRGSGVLGELLSPLVLVGAADAERRKLELLMLVPLAAVVVVFLKLTLGLRVLGLFRPILLAVAFHMTGFGPGLLVIALSLLAVALVHPWLRASHSYGRLAMVLTLICALIVLAGHVEPELLGFPVVALCLTGEAFATKLRVSGTSEALARTLATVLAALGIAALPLIPGLFHWLLRHPEVFLAEMGAVLFIEGWLNLRLLTRTTHRLHWAPLRLLASPEPIRTE